MSDDDLKRCIDCAGCSRSHGVYICTKPGATNRSPVDGEQTPVMCSLLRAEDGTCGPEGRFWQAKE